MKEILYALPGVLLTVCCWGAYGPVLHKGQALLGGDRLKPLICVGLAYFVVAIIIPTAFLIASGKLGGNWTPGGFGWSMAAGTAGAFGALGIILALTAGGKPVYVMPLVFGMAPIVNVAVSMWFAKIPWENVRPPFLIGLVLVGLGAAMVLRFQPKSSGPPAHGAHAVSPVETNESSESQDRTST